MTGTNNTEDPKTARVQTPLHLLQVLTRTLNEHLADACEQAQVDAKAALDNLEREHNVLTEQLATAQQSQPTTTDGDSAAQPSITIDELTTALATLTQSRNAAQEYVRQLQSDVRQTLRLAKGLDRIDLQVSQAIEKRNSPDAPAKSGGRSAPRRSRNRKPANAQSNSHTSDNAPAVSTD